MASIVFGSLDLLLHISDNLPNFCWFQKIGFVYNFNSFNWVRCVQYGFQLQITSEDGKLLQAFLHSHVLQCNLSLDVIKNAGGSDILEDLYLSRRCYDALNCI